MTRLTTRLRRLDQAVQPVRCQHPCHNLQPIVTVEMTAAAYDATQSLVERPASCPKCGQRSYSGIRTIYVIEPEVMTWHD